MIEAVRALNYHASAAAASLARKRIRNVGLVFFPDDDAVTNQFYSFVVQGAIKEAIERDYNLLFSYLHVPYRSYADLRLDGFKSAFERHGRKFTRAAHVVLAEALTFEAGYAATHRALTEKIAPVDLVLRASTSRPRSRR